MSASPPPEEQTLPPDDPADTTPLISAHLRQAQKLAAAGRLAGGIAHDFRNLLTIILGSSERLVEQLPPGDPLYGYAESILQSAERAADLIQRLLAFIRGQEAAPAVLSLNAVVDQAVPLIRALAGESIDVHVACKAVSDRVGADRSQIEQVLFNLVINARDAMPSGGRLTIQTEAIGGDAAPSSVGSAASICLTVADTGTGMSDDTLSHAFDPFFTTKPPGKGSGLGLSSVRDIVQQWGGGVVITSSPGEGTRVAVHLPAADAALTGAKEQQSHAIGGVETILLIEDEPDVRHLVKEMLETAGYRVLETGRPADAERLIGDARDSAALLLTDIVMPDMTGVELAAHLTRNHPGLRVLYMSGYPDRGTHADDTSQNLNLVLKPFKRDTLLRRVRETLDAR